MKVITISGHAQSGKDTAANIMKHTMNDYGKKALITHYADLLKYICTAFLEWDGKKDEAGRSLLQYVGTDLIRDEYPDYWVDFIIVVLDKLSGFGNWDYVIIPDARFPNEINKLKQDGFDVVHIRIVRPSHNNNLSDVQQGHISETALDSIIPDFILKNNSSKVDFENKIAKWTKEFIA